MVCAFFLCVLLFASFKPKNHTQLHLCAHLHRNLVKIVYACLCMIFFCCSSCSLFSVHALLMGCWSCYCCPCHVVYFLSWVQFFLLRLLLVYCFLSLEYRYMYTHYMYISLGFSCWCYCLNGWKMIITAFCVIADWCGRIWSLHNCYSLLLHIIVVLISRNCNAC